jgi:hypothetical protein
MAGMVRIDMRSSQTEGALAAADGSGKAMRLLRSR